MHTLTPTDKVLFSLLLLLTSALGWLLSYTLASTLPAHPSVAITMAMVWAGLLGWGTCHLARARVDAAPPAAPPRPAAAAPPRPQPALTRPQPPRHTITPLPDILPFPPPLPNLSPLPTAAAAAPLEPRPPRLSTPVAVAAAAAATQEVDLDAQLLCVQSLTAPLASRLELPTHPIDRAQLQPLLAPPPQARVGEDTQKIDEAELVRQMMQTQSFEVPREGRTEELTVREMATVSSPQSPQRPALETVPLLALYDEEETPISECLEAMMDALKWEGA